MSDLVLSGRNYQLEVGPDGRWAWLRDADGRPWVRLSLLAGVGTVQGRDETIAVSPPEVDRSLQGPAGPVPVVTVRRRSTLWAEAVTVVECGPGRVRVCAHVSGQGRLSTVTLLGGTSLMSDALGELYSGTALPHLFSPNPEDPRQLLRPAAAPAVVGAAGDSLPGRGHWFFTPAPFFFALGHGAEPSAAGALDGSLRGRAYGPGDEQGWLGLGLAGPVEDLEFTEMAYTPADGGFRLDLGYEGHKLVNGRFEAPAVELFPGVATPYDGMRSYRQSLVDAGHVPSSRARDRPEWWSQPMFCGWGAQCYLAVQAGGVAQEQCRADNYDRFLAELASQGVHPKTVVVDDGWQESYGRWAPHQERWPHLRAWVAARHAEGRRVLLWWKAWDPTGVPPELCITNPDGVPVAVDPGRPGAAALIGENVQALLGPEGIDADGLKVDFTGRTPTGQGLAHAGRWGIALLHEYLAQLYAAAKRAKPDALVITHAVNAAFSDVADMVRLNDLLRLDEPEPDSPVVQQMTYRAAVARAACPDLLVDTDDWCAPDLARWRQYMSVKASLGVPALHYTTHLDRTGEALQPEDYALLRQIFNRDGQAQT